MSTAEDDVRASRVRKSTLIEMDLHNAPVLSLTHFAPMIPDAIQVKVNGSGVVIKMQAVGVVASKAGERTRRPSTVFGFQDDYDRQAPDWLKKLVTDAIEN